MPGWDSPGAVETIEAAMHWLGIAALLVAVILEGWHYFCSGPSWSEGAGIIALALLVAFEMGDSIYGSRLSELKDGRLASAEQRASTAAQAAEAVRDYSDVAMLACNGAPWGAGGYISSRYTGWFGTFGHTDNDLITFDCTDMAVAYYIEALKRFPNWACVYWAIASCLRARHDPRWKPFAEDGSVDARGAAQIHGSAPIYAEMAATLERWLAHDPAFDLPSITSSPGVQR